jgi:hypothetical protein
MKKLIGILILLSVICCPAVAQSQSPKQADPGFVLLDVILYRPLGLVATVIGTGVFIGISPLTALASIPAPHDAFVKTSNILIFAPGAYTFVRPVGDRDFPYHVPRYKHRPDTTQYKTEPYKKGVMPKQRSLTPTAPGAQSPQPYRTTSEGL